MTKVNARLAPSFQSSSLSCVPAPPCETVNPGEAKPTVKVQLLVSESCAPCDQAEKVWRQVAAERALDFSVVDLAGSEGRALVDRLRLKTIPALLIDGRLIAIGVQSAEEARSLVAHAPARS